MRPSAAGLCGLLLVLSACGGGTSDEQGPSSETNPSAGVTTVPVAPESGQPSTDEGSVNEEDSEGLAAFVALAGQGGSATLTIAGETVVFESFTCYGGEAAIEEFGDDDLTFAALGVVETSSGTSWVVVSSGESPFGTNYTVVYSPTYNPAEGSPLMWQRVGGDSTTIDGDHVTSEGDFDRIVDGVHNDESEVDVGAFEATCGPDSVGLEG